MKDKMIISSIIVLLIAGLVGHMTLASKGEDSISQMKGDQAIEVLVAHYGLEHDKKQALQQKLDSLDQLIAISFDEIVASHNINKTTMTQRYEHMQRVSYIVMKMMQAYEEATGISFTYEEAEQLLFAAYLHDIRKYADGNHAKQGEKYVLANLPSYISINSESLEVIGTLIKYHSAPLTDKQREKLGKLAVLVDLLQDADKGDKILNKYEDVEKNIAKLNFKSSKVMIKKVL